MNRNKLPRDWRVITLVIVVLAITWYFNEQPNPIALPDGKTPSPTQDVASSAPNIPNPIEDSAPIVPVKGVTLYTTTDSLIYPDVAAKRKKPPMYTAFLADITAAKSKIDIAVFDIDLPELRDGLIAAHKRGVNVRVAYDDTNATDARVAQLIGALQDANIPVIPDGREPFMHEKIAAIDDNIVWTGSWNMTFNDTYRNNNQSWRFVNSTMAGFCA